MPTYTTNYAIPKPDVNDPVDQDRWGGELNDGMDIIDSTLKSIADSVPTAAPIGSGMDFWGSSAPSGWLLAYGQAVSRVTYAALFAILGVTYGSGDGSTTFNLPDKRGRASYGKDDMGGTSANRLTGQAGGIDGDVLGGVGGEESVALVEANNGPHTHGGVVTASGVNSISDGGSGTFGLDGVSVAGSTSSSGTGTPHNNVPPGIVCNYIIYAGA